MSFLVSSAALFSCGKVVETQILEIPTSNWGVKFKYYQPSEMKPAIAQAGAAVVQINDPISGSTGSGFFISSRGVLMTAAHVIPRQRCYIGSCLGLVAIRDSRPGGDNEVFKYFEPLMIDKEMDIALFQLKTEKDKIPEHVPFLKINYDQPEMGVSHWVIGHPMHGSQKFSEFIPDVLTMNGFIRGSGTVIFGNSGGPVINDRGEVLGVAQSIDSDYQMIQTNGTFESFANITPAAYLLQVLRTSNREVTACGLAPEASFEPKNEEMVGLITDKTIERLNFCKSSAMTARSKSSFFQQTLPESWDPKTVFTDPASGAAFLRHFAVRKNPMQYLAPELISNDEFMIQLARVYRSLSNRLGFWTAGSSFFQDFKNAYEKTVDFQVLSAPIRGGIIQQNRPDPFSFKSKIKVRSLPVTGKDCVAKLKLSETALSNAYNILYKCQVLPDELSRSNRAPLLADIAQEASDSPGSALIYLDMVSDYLMNGGDALTPAELRQILATCKTASKATTQLRQFMEIDQLFYRFQHPEVFNYEKLFKTDL